MSIKTKLQINLNAFIILATYMVVETYEPALKSLLTLGNMPM